jgi:hypothetical protein
MSKKSQKGLYKSGFNNIKKDATSGNLTKKKDSKSLLTYQCWAAMVKKH